MRRLWPAILLLFSFWTYGWLAAAPAQAPKGAAATASQGLSPGFPAYRRANQLLVAKKLTEAEQAVDEALRLDPKLVPALTLKAKLAMAENRYDVARKSLEQALEIDPASPYAQFLYGFEAYLTNELQLALPRLEKARQLNPSDPRAALYLGLTFESLGRTAEALACYEDAVRLERLRGPVEPESLLTGARLLLLLGRLPDSERWIRQAIEAAPGSRDAHFELARLLMTKGDARHAAGEGETALRLSGGDITDVQIQYLLIRAWQQAGDPHKAEAHAATLRALETPVRP